MRNFFDKWKFSDKGNITGFSLAGIITVSTLFVALILGVLMYFDIQQQALLLLKWLDTLGVWALFLFTLIMALVVILLLPGVLFTFGAGFVFGVVEGSVGQFFEWHTTENWEAVLTISITLMAENEPDISKRVIFQKTYGKKVPCKQKNPVALAEAMSQATADISEKITRDVYSHLKNRMRGK